LRQGFENIEIPNREVSVDNRFKNSSLAAIVLSMAQMAVAGDFSVGRAEVVLPGDGWRVLALPGNALPFGGEVSGAIKIENKIYLKESPSKKLEALAFVSASPGGIGNGYLQYSPSCNSEPSIFFAKGNSGFNQTYAECWRVFRKYEAHSVLKVLESGAYALLTKENLGLPTTFQVLTSNYSNANGTLLDVHLFLAPGILGRDGQVVDELPEGVDPKFVLLGQELAHAVRASVMSLSGKFVLPELQREP
jgi:hypothetical protein